MQEVSGGFTCLLLDAVELKMSLWAPDVSGAFEKPTPGPNLLQGIKTL